MWRKRGNYNSITEAITDRSGFSAGELLMPAREDPRAIQNLYRATARLAESLRNKERITIVGDYDSDGLNASAILVKLARYYGADPEVIIPRRKSDGYGLSAGLVEQIQPGLVITIDNGIAAVDEIESLREKGCFVIVMDHHLPGEILPSADILVDPHVEPEKNGYEFYCGAGLGYQMAMLLLEQDKTRMANALRRDIAVHAAIATITDVMPLTGMNRHIVMRGLELLNSGFSNLGAGLMALRTQAAAEVFDESTIGYKLGPLINAPGRLYDRGGAAVLKTLVCRNSTEAAGYAGKMTAINNARKAISNQCEERAVQAIENDGLSQPGAPLIIYDPEIPEGIVGIIAGRLAEKYRLPAFVFTDKHNDRNILKGSARSYIGYDLTPALDAIRPVTVSCGGHVGAAGISVERARFEDMKAAAREALVGQRGKTADVLEYDLELTEAQLQQAYQEQKPFAPFGEGVPKPVVLVRGFRSEVRFGNHFRTLGTQKDSVKINGGNADILAFGMAERYIDMSCPPVVDAIGTLGENVYNGRTTIQLEALDIRPSC